MTHTPEKLNLWDRLFNRYRKEVHDRGTTINRRFYRKDGVIIPGSESESETKWVEYRVIDRLTGSETIKREYLT